MIQYSIDSIRQLRNSLSARQSIAVLAIRITNVGILFVTSVLLARMLGAVAYGVLALARAWLTVAGQPSRLGMDKLVVRDVAVYKARADWSLLKGLLRRADQMVIAASCVAAILAWILVAPTAGKETEDFGFVLAVILLGLPLTNLVVLRDACLRGFRWTTTGQAALLLVSPLLVLGFIGLMCIAGEAMTVRHAAVFYLLAPVAALAVAHALQRRSLPREAKRAAPRFDTGAWIRAGIPMAAVGGIIVLNERTDILMLGMLASKQDVGSYSVATRCASFVAFFLTAANTVLAPRIAVWHRDGNKQEARRILVTTSRLAFGLAAPVAIAIILFGAELLALFGTDFVVAQPSLIVLALAQLSTVAAGSVSTVLLMSGEERASAVAMLCSLIINVALNLLLIPRLGILGASLATGCSIILWNLGLSVYAYRKLGILTHVLGGREG